MYNNPTTVHHKNRPRKECRTAGTGMMFKQGRINVVSNRGGNCMLTGISSHAVFVFRQVAAPEWRGYYLKSCIVEQEHLMKWDLRDWEQTCAIQIQKINNVIEIQAHTLIFASCQDYLGDSNSHSDDEHAGYGPKKPTGRSTQKDQVRSCLYIAFALH